MECESLALSKPATNRSSNVSRSMDTPGHPGAIATTLRPVFFAIASARRTRPRNSPPSKSDSRMACAKLALHFFGFDIDPLPGGGYEDIAEILESMPADAAIARIRNALQRVQGETIDDEIARLDEALKLIEAGRFDALCYSATCLHDSFDYVRMTYPAKTFDALNPGMAFRERYMHRQVDRLLGQMRAHEKLALMSHNMHLCRAPDAVAGSDAAAGPGGKDRSCPRSMAGSALSGRSVFSVDADWAAARTRSRFQRCQKQFGKSPGRSMRCSARSATVSSFLSTPLTLARGC